MDDIATSRVLGPETAKNHTRRLREGFYEKYLSGAAVLDIGYRGSRAGAQPVTEKAVGIELDYPGYDGIHLPFDDFSQDAVFASHTLEHIDDYKATLSDWFRVLRVNGYLIIAVPHQHLYERKASLPSRFNGDHKRFYTPMLLLQEIEECLPLAAYRIRSLRDIDNDFSYEVPPEQHARGSYEIELVVQKIDAPFYANQLIPTPESLMVTKFFAEMIMLAITALHRDDNAALQAAQAILLMLPTPPFRQLTKALPNKTTHADLIAVLRKVLEATPFDEQFYLSKYSVIRIMVETGKLRSGKEHFINHGYFEDRQSNSSSSIFD